MVRFTGSQIKPALKGDSSRARPVGDAARGESGGIGSIASGSAARRPYSNQRSWMRAKRADGGVASGLLLFTSTPQSIRLAAYCQLPGRGAFWVQHSFIYEHGDGFPSPHLHNLSRSPAVRRISHGAAIFHCALAQFHPFARTDFTAGVSPLISFPLQPRWSRRGSR